MDSLSGVPETMRALVLRSTKEPPTVETVPVDKPTVGSAIIRILSALTTNFVKTVYTGGLPFPFAKPLTPGTSAIGRVVALGPDATTVKVGDLVYFDCVIKSRDNVSELYLSGTPISLTEGSKKLKDIFGNGAFAEYCLAPLENLTIINETRMLGIVADGHLGYRVEQLTVIGMLLVPYGGLKDIDLQAGQTIIIAPAIGAFGGYAVMCAQAMGARVIAMGRNKDKLAELKARASHLKRPETLCITGDVESDLAVLQKFGLIDAFLEIGPAQASASTHIKLAMLSLRDGARISLMGGYREGGII